MEAEVRRFWLRYRNGLIRMVESNDPKLVVQFLMTATAEGAVPITEEEAEMRVGVMANPMASIDAKGYQHN